MIEKFIVGRYFRRIASEKFNLGLEEEIRSSLDKNGNWSDHIEWKYACGTDASISSVDRNGDTWYVVSVKCDHLFTSECPTADRAIEFLHFYFALIIDSVSRLGWPSWASGSELEPPNVAT